MRHRRESSFAAVGIFLSCRNDRPGAMFGIYASRQHWRILISILAAATNSCWLNQASLRKRGPGC